MSESVECSQDHSSQLPQKGRMSNSWFISSNLECVIHMEESPIDFTGRWRQNDLNGLHLFKSKARTDLHHPCQRKEFKKAHEQTDWGLLQRSQQKAWHHMTTPLTTSILMARPWSDNGGTRQLIDWIAHAPKKTLEKEQRTTDWNTYEKARMYFDSGLKNALNLNDGKDWKNKFSTSHIDTQNIGKKTQHLRCACSELAMRCVPPVREP